jgi:hypothetical protein
LKKNRLRMDQMQHEAPSPKTLQKVHATFTYFMSMIHSLAAIILFFSVFVIFGTEAAVSDSTCGEYHGVSVTMKGADGNLFWSLYKENRLKSISGAEFTKVCIDFNEESGDYNLKLIPVENNDNSSNSGESVIEVEVALNEEKKGTISYNSSDKSTAYQTPTNFTVPQTPAPTSSSQYNISCEGYLDDILILISNPDPENTVIWTFTRFDKFDHMGKGENFGNMFCLSCGEYRFDILSEKPGVASYTLVFNRSQTTVTETFGFWSAYLIDYSCASPTASPTNVPSRNPTSEPTPLIPYPSRSPLAKPSTSPSVVPTENPSNSPSANPSAKPSSKPSANPSANPSASPSANPSKNPSVNPSSMPSSNPSANPTFNPSASPTASPSENPTFNPSANPSFAPSQMPSDSPTESPTTTSSCTGSVQQNSMSSTPLDC